MAQAIQRRVTLRLSPPGNMARRTTTSNSQYRICFRWTEAGPEDVDVVDYH
jgi:proteic killer suppression protein